MNHIATQDYDVEAVRAQFPLLVNADAADKPVAFLDSAASAQKPQAVIAAMTAMMTGAYANVHRGVYGLSQEATARFEGARETVRAFLNAASVDEIVFTKGATEAINLVAASHAATHLKPGQAVLITAMEHHANIVPWQMLRERAGIELRVAPITDDGDVDWPAFEALLDDTVGLVAVPGMSNVLGTVLPIARLAEQAHAVGAKILVDACQSVVHEVTDVQALDVDFLVFSGHKLYGPTGIGILYAKADLLAAMPPWQGGGDMIDTVTFEKTTFAAPPARFEAGTPPIVEAIGLAAAIDFVTEVGLDAIAAHEHRLLVLATQKLGAIPGLTVYGTVPGKGAVLSFGIDGIHHQDVGHLLDKQGVAVRCGHHCAQPLMQRLGVPGTTRASFAAYTTEAEVEALAKGVEKVVELFG